jgi:glyoxylase-like metal-dependent hydrolase (beta-lactamase superfamily II)
VTALDDGDTIAGLELVHTPGHTLGHAALADAASGDLFVGDAVLSTYTPNVGGGDTRLDDPLAAYLDTLDRIEKLGWTDANPDAITLHPGHGASVEFPFLLETLLDHPSSRSLLFLDVLSYRGPSSPWDVASYLFFDMRGYHAKMGAGEAAAHLVRLRSSERVELVGEEPDLYDYRVGR